MTKKGRTKTGQFASGHAGFRVKGQGHKFTEFRKMAKAKEPEILEKLFALALSGHSTALTFVCTKSYGNAPLPDGIGLQGKTTKAQINNLNKLILSGEISAADIGPLVDLAKVQQMAVEIEELKSLIKEIKRAG